MYNKDKHHRKFLLSNGKVFLRPKIVGRFVPLEKALVLFVGRYQ